MVSNCSVWGSAAAFVCSGEDDGERDLVGETKRPVVLSSLIDGISYTSISFQFGSGVDEASCVGK